MNVRHLSPSFAVALALGVIVLLAGAAALPREDAPRGEVELAIAKIYFEYNSSANDLGVHVFLDGEDWRRMSIENPDERVIFDVRGTGPYARLGMTELFFEGAEPNLSEVPLARLLAMFPAGEYEFSGRTVDDEEIEGEGILSHAIPAGPVIRAEVGANALLRIHWSEVTAPPPGFPQQRIQIRGYQVIVGTFQVTLPATARQVTVPPEFVAALGAGTHNYEVLAIEQSGIQSITEGTFVK